MTEVYGRELFRDKLRNDLEITQAYLLRWIQSTGKSVSYDTITAFGRNPYCVEIKNYQIIMSAIEEIEKAKACSLEWDKETKETLIEENYRRYQYGR